MEWLEIKVRMPVLYVSKPEMDLFFRIFLKIQFLSILFIVVVRNCWSTFRQAVEKAFHANSWTLQIANVESNTKE